MGGRTSCGGRGDAAGVVGTLGPSDGPRVKQTQPVMAVVLKPAST